jgi:hypothetical protein
MDYCQYRDTVSKLIEEMESHTPARWDDAIVFVYRWRFERMRARHARKISEIVGVDLEDGVFGVDELNDYCCRVCGLNIYDCYAGGVHSSPHDRLLDESLSIQIEGCDKDGCDICHNLERIWFGAQPSPLHWTTPRKLRSRWPT